MKKKKKWKISFMGLIVIFLSHWSQSLLLLKSILNLEDQRCRGLEESRGLRCLDDQRGAEDQHHNCSPERMWWLTGIVYSCYDVYSGGIWIIIKSVKKICNTFIWVYIRNCKQIIKKYKEIAQFIGVYIKNSERFT